MLFNNICKRYFSRNIIYRNENQIVSEPLNESILKTVKDRPTYMNVLTIMTVFSGGVAYFHNDSVQRINEIKTEMKEIKVEIKELNSDIKVILNNTNTHIKT